MTENVRYQLKIFEGCNSIIRLMCADKYGSLKGINRTKSGLDRCVKCTTIDNKKRISKKFTNKA
jgi:hypothetical protein